MLRQASDESEHSPLLTDEGRRLLRWMREHPCAPRFNFECGDHLAFHHWAWLKGFEGLLRKGFQWPQQGPPSWVWPYACSALERVPHYRSYAASGSDWHDIPPLDKEVLRRQPQMLVPDDVSLDDMVVYDTSGTTGNKMLVPSAPTVSASYLPLLCYGLSLHGVHLEPTPGRVAFLQVGLQQSTLTYAMISSFLDQSGFAKLNLNPKEWREPEHRARYINDCKPQVLTGNPLAFAELARLPLKHQPKALVSSAMTLMPGARLELERHFGCPVFDMYSMTECMAIALADAKLDKTAVHYINAHGTSTPAGDKAETDAVKGLFGDYAYKVAMSSTKSMVGHMLGAAGGVEAVYTVLAIRDQVAPPTINLQNPDPECDLDYVPNVAREMKIDVALSNSFGFGGTNGTLIFKRI